MTRRHLFALPVLVAIGVTIASPVSATDPVAPPAAATDSAAPSAEAPTVDLKQAKYILHVDGMT